MDANPRWRAGRRVFRLTSSSTDSRTIEDVETAAEGDYIARGILDSEGSTREFSIVRESVADDRQITRTSTRETRITSAFTGRPARGIVNRLVKDMEYKDDIIPDFPTPEIITFPFLEIRAPNYR